MHYIDCSIPHSPPHALVYTHTHTDTHHTTPRTSETMQYNTRHRQYNTRHRHCPHGEICWASVRTWLKDKTSNTYLKQNEAYSACSGKSTKRELFIAQKMSHESNTCWNCLRNSPGMQVNYTRFTDSTKDASSRGFLSTWSRCTSGGVHVPCIYSHAMWEVPYMIQVFVRS